MSQNLVGFSMHPLWVESPLGVESPFAPDNQKLTSFLEPLRSAGLGALEFTLDGRDPHWARFEPLIEACAGLGFALCFHAPYLPPHTLTGFSDDRAAAIVDDYVPMLDIAARYAPTMVVVHGAHSETRPVSRLVADTVAFFRWALARARYPGLGFALENLTTDPQKSKIGTDPAEMLEILRQVDDPRLGFCWDMGHEAKSERSELPDEGWLAHVSHVHLHDVSGQGVDHYPLIHGRVPYQAWLEALIQTGFSGIVSLELKGGLLAHLPRNQVRELLRESVGKIAQLILPAGHSAVGTG